MNAKYKFLFLAVSMLAVQSCGHKKSATTGKPHSSEFESSHPQDWVMETDDSVTDLIVGSVGRIDQSSLLKSDPNAIPDVVYFDFDSSKVYSDGVEIVSRHVKNISKMGSSASKVTLSLEGHCDSRGTREYNFALGMKRAEAVNKEVTHLLKKKKLDVDVEVKTKSYGKDKLVDLQNTREAHAKNRRVEFSYAGSQGKKHGDRND